jgi:V8-like Glu-specific endopeptidase
VLRLHERLLNIIKRHQLLSFGVVVTTCFFLPLFLLGRGRPARLSNPIAETSLSVVRIDSETPAGWTAHGTGFFFVDNRTIATAAHVAQGAFEKARWRGKIYARRFTAQGGELSVPVEILAIDAGNDIALLSFDPAEAKRQWPDFSIRPLFASSKELVVGDELALVGYIEQAKMPAAQKGIFSAVEFDGDMTTNIETYSGQSGSPVIALPSGRVLGVQVRFFIWNYDINGSKFTVNQARSVFINVTYLERLFEGQKRNPQPFDPDKDFPSPTPSPSPVAEDLAPQVRIKPEGSPRGELRYDREIIVPKLAATPAIK